MADCVIVCFSSGSFYLFLSVYLSVSICHSVSFGFYGGAPGGGAPGGSAPGERSFVLYIRGVDRLGEKIKHFYLSSRVPHLRDYHLLSEASRATATRFFFVSRMRGRVSFVLPCFSFFSFVLACVGSRRRSSAERPHQLAKARRR
jgi:hypothetical protein